MLTAQAKYTEAKPTKAKFAQPKHAQAKYRQVCSGQAGQALTGIPQFTLLTGGHKNKIVEAKTA